MTVAQATVQQHGEEIGTFLSHSFPSISVEHVAPDTVQHPEAEELRDTHQAYFRLVIQPETKQDILDTRGDVRNVLQDQLRNMEVNSSAPDTRIVVTHHPPRHIKKSLVFYTLATL